MVEVVAVLRLSTVPRHSLPRRSHPSSASQAVELTHDQIPYEQEYSLFYRIGSPGLPPSASTSRVASRLAQRRSRTRSRVLDLTVPADCKCKPHIERTPFASRSACSLRLEGLLWHLLVSPLQSAQRWHVEWNSEMQKAAPWCSLMCGGAETYIS
jgi:hypothetical protein